LPFHRSRFEKTRQKMKMRHLPHDETHP